MLGRIRSKLTYANVMATTAVFITLGGGAYAASALKANSVGSAQLKKGAVTNKKIASNAVTGAKVKDGSLLKADFAAGQLAVGAAGAKGDTGPKGDTGLKGDKGDAGQQGVQGIPGPTFGTQSIADSFTPGNFWAEKTFTLPTAGRVLAFGHTRHGFSCGAGGSCFVTWALNVDGTYVPGTKRQTPVVPASGSGTFSMDFQGITTDPLPAGDHTLTLTWTGSTNFGGGSTAEDNVGVVLLGG
jgi:hypothetical protein